MLQFISTSGKTAQAEKVYVTCLLPQIDFFKTLDQGENGAKPEVIVSWFNDDFALEIKGDWAGENASRQMMVLAVYQVNLSTSCFGVNEQQNNLSLT